MSAADADNAPAAVLIGRDAPLLERVRCRPWEFEFFQALWLLERYCGGEVLVGQRGPAADETIRLRPDLSLAFPATDLRQLAECPHAGRDEPCFVLDVAFMGLYGVSTPLPLHYAVELLRSATMAATPRVDEPADGQAGRPEGAPGSNSVRDFLDIFNHRALSLFYRSWLKYRYERLFGLPQRDAITEYLRLLIGCPPSFDQRALGVAPIRLLRYAGVLTQHPRSAEALEGLLCDYWGDLPIRVRAFAERWVPVEPPDQNRLGLANGRPGFDLTIGDQVYDLGGAFQVCIGPLDWQTYLSFVPGGYRFSQTCALTTLCCCDALAFSFELTLRPGEIPPTQLSAAETAGRLGLTTWLRTAELGQTSVTFAASDAEPFRSDDLPDTPQAHRSAPRAAVNASERTL